MPEHDAQQAANIIKLFEQIKSAPQQMRKSRTSSGGWFKWSPTFSILAH
jgi:hypothetical protein